MAKKENTVPETKRGTKDKGSFFDRYGAKIILGILLLYIILLMTGTVAEIFHIDSILDWWIWRPVGR